MGWTIDGAQSASVQDPIPADGDSVYTKDIDLDNSDNYNFTNSVLDYFNSLKTINTDTTANNPKQIKVAFKRTIYASDIGLGCDNLLGNFSNIKLELLGSGDVVRFTLDLSSDSTKLNSKLLSFGPKAFNGFILSFVTADQVCLSNITVRKETKNNSVLQALKPDGTAVFIGATESGNLKVANVESGLAIAKGDVVKTSFVHKFGQAPDFDTADGFVTIWDGADDANLDLMNYVFSTTDAIDSISSSNAGDTEPLEIQGLDGDYNLVTQVATLNGQNRVALTTPLIRVFRMKNIGSNNLLGFAYCYENTALTGGVPTDKTKVRALIQIGNNQTLMAVYTVPANTSSYMRDWYAAQSNRSASDAIIKVKARPFGGVFQLKHISTIKSSGTSTYQHNYKEPEVFEEKTDIIMESDSSVNTASVAAGFDIVNVEN